MKWAGIAAGAVLALAAIGVLWATALVDPPESVSRALAIISILYTKLDLL